MPQQFKTGHIVSVLRKTLRRLEEDGSFRRDDPAFIHLKRQLVLAIAELEAQKSSLSERLEKPVIVLRIRKPGQSRRAPKLELCSQEN